MSERSSPRSLVLGVVGEVSGDDGLHVGVGLRHVGQQLVEDRVHGGRGESDDGIQKYNRKIFPEIESYLIL